ncbi:hypothetical protein BN1195_03607 [Chryseobacterium oranimense G311]|uniref:hypothetical protein n=1 Tax=Chryseobacterium oranimense TaxID=421058 RepID=UPI000533AD01|nr:hypothetical protein [Chryseobacterium oranimense]CEJ71262.1 hypothetical protein BN1195_03607 [Chryseobacterium oranimense G311]DAG72871.1 MAG TPA: hypothetical protein [Caudoviricetes sp.]
MINHHILLNNLINGAFSIEYNSEEYVIKYTEGDLFELTKKLADSSSKYPLIWLQTGYVVSEGRSKTETVLKGCRIFFITKGSFTDRYKKRFEDTYQNILYPMLSLFRKLINKTKGITITSNWSYTALPLNDVDELNSKEENGKKKTEKVAIGDIWDAIILEIDLTISEGCFPELIIKN